MHCTCEPSQSIFMLQHPQVTPACVTSLDCLCASSFPLQANPFILSAEATLIPQWHSRSPIWTPKPIPSSSSSSFFFKICIRVQILYHSWMQKKSSSGDRMKRKECVPVVIVALSEPMSGLCLLYISPGEAKWGQWWMEVGRRLLAGDGAAANTAECENQHMKRVYRFCLTPSYVDFAF